MKSQIFQSADQKKRLKLKSKEAKVLMEKLAASLELKSSPKKEIKITMPRSMKTINHFHQQRLNLKMEK